MYEKYKRLLEKIDKTSYQVSKETGISQTAFSNWKTGRSEPGLESLRILANYFNVPIEYFQEGVRMISIGIHMALTAIILVIQISIMREQSKIKEYLKRQELKEREKRKTAQLDIPEWAEKVIDEYMANSDSDRHQ